MTARTDSFFLRLPAHAEGGTEAIRSAIECIESFTDRFNDRDRDGMDARLHWPSGRAALRQGREPAGNRILQAPRRANRLAALSTDEKARGTIARSSGNHGLAIAYCAGLMGTTAVVVAPDTAPATKIARIAAYGARVVQVPMAKDQPVPAPATRSIYAKDPDRC